MTIAPYFSDKIRIISFLSIILVLYIHSDFHDYPHEILGMPMNHHLQDFISKMTGRCAVPLFFAISGFLFFVNTSQGLYSILMKIKKRIKTILIPFVITSLFFPSFFFILSLFKNSSNFINNDILSYLIGKDILEILRTLFVDSGTGQPLAFHLWFLRDLIGIVLISPLLYGIKRYMPNDIPSLLCFFIACTFSETSFFTSIFWFMFGSEYLNRLEKIKTKAIPVIFLLCCFAELSYPYDYWKYIKIPIICIGIITIWNTYDIFVGKNFNLSKHHRLSIICSFTFFIYLYHEPIINIVRKLLVLALGKSPFAFATAYLLSPWITICLTLLTGLTIKKKCPKVYGILVGGR